MTVIIEFDNPLILPKLKSWLKQNDAKAKIVAEKGLDFEKFDAQTKRRINAYYDAKEKGEVIKLIFLEEIMAAENGI